KCSYTAPSGPIASAVGDRNRWRRPRGAAATQRPRRNSVRSISKRTLRRGAAPLLAGTAAATSLLAAAASPAAAEPSGTPAATDIVAVGSDTIQGLYDQYQVHYPGLSSWDATGASPITPKDGCAPITRPAGSGAGIAALGANATTADGAHYCLDIA